MALISACVKGSEAVVDDDVDVPEAAASVVGDSAVVVAVEEEPELMMAISVRLALRNSRPDCSMIAEPKNNRK